MTALISPPVRSTASATIGMVGGGQLARMTHQAAIALGVDVCVLSSDVGDPAVQAGARHRLGEPSNLSDLLGLAEGCDVVTFDHERIPNEHLQALASAGHAVRPNPDAKHLAQDKAFARGTLGHAGFAVPPFASMDAGDVIAVERFARSHGWPLVLKAPRGGYDGRGVEVLRSREDLDRSRLAATAGSWLIEAMVPIATELAVLVARRPSGRWVTYPVIETVQRDGICRELLMPARIAPVIAQRAIATAVSIADGIDATGILAVELFLTPDNELIVNELAARPHNSGHATIDASCTSQFENHLRAILDWPLGDTTMHARAAATVNLLGPTAPLDLARALPTALEDPTISVHLYRKDPRPGRKLGHVTALADDTDVARRAAHRAALTLVGR